MDERDVGRAGIEGGAHDDDSRDLSVTEELLRASIQNLDGEMLEEEDEESDDSSSDNSPRSAITPIADFTPLFSETHVAITEHTSDDLQSTAP